MTLKSGPDRYGLMAVSIHWATAALILILVLSGFRAANALDPAAKAAVLRAHIPIAVAALALTVFRIGWWSWFDRRPIPVAGSPRWQELSARAVHILLYAAVLAMIASGAGMIVLSGAAPFIFGGNSALLPDFALFPPRRAHAVMAWLLIGLIAIHASAALYHHFIRRDGLIRRMWFGGAVASRSTVGAILAEKAQKS